MSLFGLKRRTTSTRPPAEGDTTLARRARRRRTWPTALEGLEPRALLSGFRPNYLLVGPQEALASPSGFSPAQIRHAYGFDQVQFSSNGQTIAGDGAGRTIAIVDAFDDPNIAGDLQAFDRQFSLTDPVLIKATPEGTPPPDGGWAVEIALDVEWAHAIAPAARILLVEAKSNSFADLLGAVDYAASQPGVSAVSMSWGSGEFPSETSSDGHFAGHPGVTFVATSGDSGAPPSYPAVSPNVLAVGGTTLRLNSDNTWSSETGWGGSGGGISLYEAKPTYQGGVPQSATQRTSPDVAYDADPNTGFPVYDSYGQTGGNWIQVGGTSAGAPQWSALVAIADQGRTLAGQGPLDSSAETLGKLYSMPGANFHDILVGNNGFPAGPGYDLVTGLGSPIADRVVASLVNPVGGTWQLLPGAANDIGVGADGSAWVIGQDQEPGGYGIYHWVNNNWVQVDGGAVRIAVGPDGAPWVVNSQGLIFHRVGGTWQLLPGAANDIGVGADGSAWVIGQDQEPGGYGIYHWVNNNWVQVDGSAAQITVGPDGAPWVVNKQGLIFHRL
jgi:hypothetical protein